MKYNYSFFLLVFGILLKLNTQAQCDYTFTYFLNTTTNQVNYYFINPYPAGLDGVTWNIDLGDGSPVVNNEYNFQHTYASGDYYVCLTGTKSDSLGTCSFTFCDTVHVNSTISCIDTLLNMSSAIPPCISSFWCPVCGCDGVEYDNACEAERYGVKSYKNGRCSSNVPIWETGIYVDQCSGHIEAQLNGYVHTCYQSEIWYFGDGDSLLVTGQATNSVEHEYLVDGVYNLCVQIFDPRDSTSGQLVCEVITIQNTNQCLANFSWNFIGDSLFLTNTSSGNQTYEIVSWSIQIDSLSGLNSFTDNPAFNVSGGDGSYKVCLTIRDDSCLCYADTCMDVIKKPTYIKDLGSRQINIYPNPNSGLFTIDLPVPIENVQIFSISGQLINEKKGLFDEKFQFDDSFLPGVYLITLRSTNQEIVSLPLYVK